MFPVRSAAIQKILNRADMANSQFIDPDELIDLANDNLEKAYHECVAAYGDTTFATEYFLSGLGGNGTPTTWPTLWTGSPSVTVQSRFPLPADFGRLLRCEFTRGTINGIASAGKAYHVLAANQQFWTPMHPLDITGMVYDSTPHDWHESQAGYWITAHPGAALPAELDEHDTESNFWIAFLPIPTMTVSVHIQYVPIAPVWGSDDTDLIRLNPLVWKFVRESTAADLLEKQRSDSSALRNNAAGYLADIQNSKIHPDFANPQGTVDVYGGSGISPYGRRRQVWGG